MARCRCMPCQDAWRPKIWPFHAATSTSLQGPTTTFNTPKEDVETPELTVAVVDVPIEYCDLPLRQQALQGDCYVR